VRYYVVTSYEYWLRNVSKSLSFNTANTPANFNLTFLLNHVVVFFYVHGSVHRESMSIIVQQDATTYSLLYFCKLLYMFRVVSPPSIRSIYNCNYSIWHWSNRVCYLPRSWNCNYSIWHWFNRVCYLLRSWNCNYSTWHWTNRVCYLPRSWRSWNCRHGLTSARYCNYSYMCSWWLVEIPPEICRAVYINIINCM